MPKKTPNRDSLAFGERLRALMSDRFPERRGAGAWLARRYKVSTVTANGWLNGEYRAETELARRIAEDQGTTFDWLYFGKPATAAKVNEPTARYGDPNDLTNDIRQIMLALTGLCAWIRETRPIEAPSLAETLEKLARMDGQQSAHSPLSVLVSALKGSEQVSKSNATAKRSGAPSRHP
jgi:hypothetical protein